MNSFLSHVRTLWPGSNRPGWRGHLSRWRWLLIILPFVLWPTYCFAIGERRWEHAVVFALLPTLAWSNRTTRKLLVGLYPLALVGLAYDAMRFVKNVGLSPDRIHTCDLEQLDTLLFFGPAGQSWPAWFLAHGSLSLDVFFAIPYATFIYVTVAYAVWLYRADYDGMRRFSWTFFFTNIAGFLTYHIYPAAPPWYVHAHGCVADLAVRASTGVHLMRVDEWLGVDYFASFYSRSSDVFGAMPSLHVAYPMLLVLFGWRRHGALGRTLAVGFWLWMSTAAVYLDHHWVADVVAGWSYTVLAYLPVRWLFFQATARLPATTAVLVGEGTGS